MAGTVPLSVIQAIQSQTGVAPNTTLTGPSVQPDPASFVGPPAPQVSTLSPEQLEEVVKYWELRADIADDLTTSARVQRLADALSYEQEHPELFSGQTYNFAPEQMMRYAAAQEKLEKTDERHQGRSQSDIDAAYALIRDRKENPDRHAGDQTWIRTQSADLPDFLQGVNLKEIILGVLDLLGMRNMLEPFVNKLAPGYNHADAFTDMFSNIYKKALNEMNEEGYTGGVEQVEKLVLDEVQSMIDRGALVFDNPEDQARFMQEIKTSIQMSYEKGFDRATFVNRMHEVAEQLGVREGTPQVASVTVTLDVDMDNAVGKDLHDELTSRMGMMGANLDDFMDAHMALNDGNRYEDFFQSMQSKLINPSYAGEAGYTQAIKDTFQEFAAQGRLFDMNGVDINTMIDAWAQNGDFAATHDTARRYLTQTMASAMDNVLQPASAPTDTVPVAQVAEYDDGLAHEGSVDVDTATLQYVPVLNDDGMLRVLDIDQFGDAFQNACFTTVMVGSGTISNSAEFSMDEIASQLGSRQFHIETLENAAGDVYAHKLIPVNDPSHPGIHINSYDYQAEIDAAIDAHAQKIAEIDAELARLNEVTYAENAKDISPDMIAQPMISGRIENGQFMAGQPVTLSEIANQLGTQDLQMRGVMVGGHAMAIEISRPGDSPGQGVMFEINDFKEHLINSRNSHEIEAGPQTSRYTDPSVLPMRGALGSGFNAHATGLSAAPVLEGNGLEGHIAGFNLVASNLTVSGAQLANTLGNIPTLQPSADGGFAEGQDAGNLINQNAQYATATLRDDYGPVAYQFDSGDGNPVIVAATGDVPEDLRTQIASATPDPNAQPEQSLSYNIGQYRDHALAGPGGMAA